jgi:hypothetical protein
MIGFQFNRLLDIFVSIICLMASCIVEFIIFILYKSRWFRDFRTYTDIGIYRFTKVFSSFTSFSCRGGIASDILSKDRLPDRGALLKDPALEHLTRLQDEWIDWKGVLPSGLPAKEKGIWKAQMKAMVARNLYFQDIDFSKGAVEKEVQRIQEARKQYKDIELFRGRSVVHIAPAEGRAPRFGTKATQESLAYQQDGKGTYEFLRSSPKVTKEAILQKIRMTPSPATFVFDMDGSDAGKDQQAPNHGIFDGKTKQMAREMCKKGQYLVQFDVDEIMHEDSIPLIKPLIEQINPQ